MSEHLELDEMLVLRQYRQSKEQGHCEGEWAVKDGKLAKLWITSKVDLEIELREIRRMREIDQPHVVSNGLCGQ